MNLPAGDVKLIHLELLGGLRFLELRRFLGFGGLLLLAARGLLQV